VNRFWDLAAYRTLVKYLVLKQMAPRTTPRACCCAWASAAREVVRHRENGLLFERGNLDSLARTINLAADDSALRERIGRSALTSVASHALERMAAEYDRVFHEVLASP
jgi:glycosyltransferase involved in cell wall biosynthesis